MLMIQSNKGQVKITAIGTQFEMCAETASVIRAIAAEMTMPLEETKQKRVMLNMLRNALDYAIDDAEKEAFT